VTIDARGRALPSKTLRLLPEVSGDFRHTVEQVDRLDHLAYKYYKQPRKWWRICDANPEFMSPQALLGKESQVAARFPIVWEGPMPPWPILLRALADTIGIEDARMGASDQPLPDTQVFDDTLLFAIDASLAADLSAGVLTQGISIALRQALQDGGVTLASEVRFSFVDENRWRITDRVSEQIYTFKLEASALNVCESVARYTWAVTVTYNEMNVTAQEIADLMSSLGFSVSPSETIGRVGKRIIIPPNVTG
jgi:hypothetical protein